MAQYNRSEKEAKAVVEFLDSYFVTTVATKLSAKEATLAEGIYTYVDSMFDGAKYVLGLALDFCLIAEQLSDLDDELKKFDSTLTSERLFEKYERITVENDRTLNTLTLEFNGKRFGIRTVDNRVGTLMHSLGRTSYPSSSPYATGQWAKYTDSLFVPAFQLSTAGRLQLCNRLFDLALQRITENRFFATKIERARLFDSLVRDYPRGIKGENAGVIYQGIAYGFFRADSPHLSLVTDKVRTGSKRQKRFGDIDGYYGLHLELSIEVKDLALHLGNLDKEVSGFCHEVHATGSKGIVFANAIDADAYAKLKELGVVPFSEDDMLGIVQLWDWQKQDIALHGFMHYLAHIEANPDAVKRFLSFIREVEPTHDSLSSLRVLEDSAE